MRCWSRLIDGWGFICARWYPAGLCQCLLQVWRQGAFAVQAGAVQAQVFKGIGPIVPVVRFVRGICVWRIRDRHGRLNSTCMQQDVAKPPCGALQNIQRGTHGNVQNQAFILQRHAVPAGQKPPPLRVQSGRQLVEPLGVFFFVYSVACCCQCSGQVLLHSCPLWRPLALPHIVRNPVVSQGVVLLPLQALGKKAA